MVDISKCDGEGCEFKRQCYRYMASKSLYQSWLEPEYNEDGVCMNYMPHRGTGHLPKSRMREQVVKVDPLLDMSKPLGTRLSQAEFDELKARVRNAHHARSWYKKGGEM